MITGRGAGSFSSHRSRCEESMPESVRTGTFSGRVVVMFGTQVVEAAVGVVNGILLARLLGPVGKGEYYLLLLLPTTMMVVLQLGLPQAFSYFSARGQTVRLVTKSFALTGALSAIGFAFVLVLLPVIQEAILHGLSLELVLFAFLVLPLLLQAPLSAATVMGRQAVRWYAAVKLAQPLITTILIVVVIGLLGQGVTGAVGIFIAVAVINTIGFVVAAVSVTRTVPRPEAASFRQLLNYGLRFYPASLSGFFSQRIDIYLIALLLASPSEALGYYSMAVAFAEIVFLFPSAVTANFFPHVAGSSRGDADREVALVSRVTLHVSGLLALVLIPCAVAMIWVLLPAFKPSIPPLLVLLPGVVALSAANVVGGYITGIGRPGISSGISVIALVVNVAANLVLIPAFGILGAASASLISYTFASLVVTSVAARFSRTPLWRFWVPRLAEVRSGVTMSADLARRAYASVRALAQARDGRT
jgi:O-antigen/teichoic acid export membrane protein